MRSIHWLFIVSVALFVSGIGFVIAAERTQRHKGPVDSSITLTPVASIKQIMRGIVTPSATAIFQSVGTIMTSSGTEERQPQNDAEWEAVGSSAAAIIEAGNLLMIGNRVIDKGDWLKMSRDMIDVGKIVLKATQAKSTDDLLAAGGDLNGTCDACHQRYERVSAD
jgi:hypothetical protein